MAQRCRDAGLASIGRIATADRQNPYRRRHPRPSGRRMVPSPRLPSPAEGNKPASWGGWRGRAVIFRRLPERRRQPRFGVPWGPFSPSSSSYCSSAPGEDFMATGNTADRDLARRSFWCWSSFWWSGWPAAFAWADAMWDSWRNGTNCCCCWCSPPRPSALSGGSPARGRDTATAFRGCQQAPHLSPAPCARPDSRMGRCGTPTAQEKRRPRPPAYVTAWGARYSSRWPDRVLVGRAESVEAPSWRGCARSGGPGGS
jgi:hypothetical protein